MSSRRGTLILVGLAIAVAVAGCAGGSGPSVLSSAESMASPSPVSTAGPTVAAPTSAASPAAAATPAGSSTCPLGVPLPTPHVYADIQKLSEGAHGFVPPLDLPCAIDVDYQVMGTCSFDIAVTDEAASPGLPHFHLDVAKPGISGTWSFEITPGTYSVTPSEAVGCTFHVTVRAKYP
jgi:hypothetical protein